MAKNKELQQLIAIEGAKSMEGNRKANSNCNNQNSKSSNQYCKRRSQKKLVRK